MSIPFADFLPQMSAVLRVTYDRFENSFDLRTLPGTSFTKEELQVLVGANLALVSVDLPKKELTLAKKGIKVLSIDGRQFNDKDAYVCKQGVADVRVSLDKIAFPKSPPATLACEKEREIRLKRERDNRLRSNIAIARLGIENTFHMLGIDASSRLKEIEKERDTTLQLQALKREVQILKSAISRYKERIN